MKKKILFPIVVMMLLKSLSCQGQSKDVVWQLIQYYTDSLGLENTCVVREPVDALKFTLFIAPCLNENLKELGFENMTVDSNAVESRAEFNLPRSAISKTISNKGASRQETRNSRGVSNYIRRNPKNPYGYSGLTTVFKHATPLRLNGNPNQLLLYLRFGYYKFAYSDTFYLAQREEEGMPWKFTHIGCGGTQ